MKAEIINYGTDNRYPERVLQIAQVPFYERYRSTIRLINANFVIRVYRTVRSEPDEYGFVEEKVIKTLIGGGMINKIMREKDAYDAFNVVLNGIKTKYTFWNRKDLRIEFIAK